MNVRDDDTPPDPHEDRLNRIRARERLSPDDFDPPSSDEGRGARAWSPARVLAPLLAGDTATRRLTYGAFGLGALLLLGVGGWTLFGHHQSGIPVLGPPAVPLREKPADPGGMELDGMMAPTEQPEGAARLAPGPEQPDPEALAARYGGKAAEEPEGGASPAPAASPAAGPVAGNDQPAPAAGGAASAPAAAPGTVAAQDIPVPAAHAPASPAVPPAASAPAAARQAETPAPAAPAAPVSETATASGPYGVQLGALNSEAAAQAEWARLKATSPALFAGHAPVVEKITRSNAIFYRLRTRGFSSVAAAQTFCVGLREHGHACNVLRP